MKLNYIVKKNDEKYQLKYILKKQLHISSKLLINLKKNQCILVNNTTCFVNNFVHENDIITVNLDNIDESINSNIVPYHAKLNIIYEDEYIIAIDKPSNIEIHPSLNNYDKTIANMIMAYYIEKNYNIKKIHIITRLDKNTSGVCIIAKNEYIQELFLRKKDTIHFQKEYIAIVNGVINNDHDIIEENIGRKEGSIIEREVKENGDYAKTEYFVLQRNYEKNYTIIKVLLHTGRTHQIRVHMAYIGHVLLRR